MAAITEIPDSPQDPIPPNGRDAVDSELKNRDEGFLGGLVGSILEVRPLPLAPSSARSDVQQPGVNNALFQGTPPSPLPLRNGS
jgi:hypothetical protein